MKPLTIGQPAAFGGGGSTALDGGSGVGFGRMSGVGRWFDDNGER